LIKKFIVYNKLKKKKDYILNMEGNKNRIPVNYRLDELKLIQKKSQILSLQIEVKSEEGTNIIWQNQKDCGEKICKEFENSKIINVLVYGKTQTGKTGCMTSLIQHYILSNNIPINNIYIITGLSDKAWKADTMNRMPDSITDRVYHRADLHKKFVEDIRGKKNVLVIMDEIQIASDIKQTIHTTFNECGFYDLKYLLENDIKLVQFTATPDGHINDISDWREHSSKVKLLPGEGYTGTEQLSIQKRIRQFQNLTDLKNVQILKNVVDSFDPVFYKEGNNLKDCKYRYHTIRIPNSRKGLDEIVINNFKEVFGKNYIYNTNYLNDKKDDINDLMRKAPNKHTFIFIKEILRCAKTKIKKFIGIEYERWTTSSDSSIIQGSVGRLTGYDDNTDSICYTNKETIENYEKLWNNDMEFKEGIEWNTKTTIYDKKDNKTYSSGTYNSVKNIKGLEDNSSQKVKTIITEPEISNPFNTFEEIVEYGKKLKIIKRTPKKPDKNKIKDGFYMVNISGKKRILSENDLFQTSRVTSGMGKSKYVIRNYYSNIADPNTIQWRLIYYK